MRQRFRVAREAKELTQEQLARRVGVSAPCINKIEAGTRKPSLRVAIRLQNVLGEPIERLLETANGQA